MSKYSGLMMERPDRKPEKKGGDSAKNKQHNGQTFKKENISQEYMDELKAYVDSIHGPNDGRIQELRDLIKKGKLITKEAVREAAEKISRQLLDGGEAW